MLEEKGKCFSLVDRGQRKKSDLYNTPYSITSSFLDTGEIELTSSILEPASGHGAIVKVLRDYSASFIYYYDINHIEMTEKKDFLQESKQYSQVLTNPPFSLAYEFILKCKEIATKKFALLLPLSYLHGKGRYDRIWVDRTYPLKKIYVYTRYPMLGDTLREDGKYRTGMVVYAWYVWERGHEGPPSIDWIDNNRYVLKKGE